MFQRYYVKSQSDLVVTFSANYMTAPFLALHLDADPQNFDRARFEFVGECSDSDKAKLTEFYGLAENNTFHPETHKLLSQEVLHEATLQIVTPQNLGRGEYGVEVFHRDFDSDDYGAAYWK